MDKTSDESLCHKIRKQHIRAFKAFADCIVQDMGMYSSNIQGGIAKKNMQRLQIKIREYVQQVGQIQHARGFPTMQFRNSCRTRY